MPLPYYQSKLMRIEVQKFGTLLVSRPSGREAYLATKSSLLRDVPADTEVEIDFAGVQVLTPAWTHEFLTLIGKEFPHSRLANTKNVSVRATIEFLEETYHKKFKRAE